MKNQNKIGLWLCCIITVILFLQNDFVIEAGESESLNPYEFQVNCKEKRDETIQSVPLYDITLEIKSKQSDFDGVIQIEVVNKNNQRVVYEKVLSLKQGEEQTIDFSCIFYRGNINYHVYALEKKSRDIVYRQEIQNMIAVDEKELIQEMDMGISRVTLQDMPATWTFFLTFLFYFILVGPVLYLILKKTRHRTWIWFLLPCIAIIVTIGIYIATAKTRITKPLVRSFSLMDIQQDQTYVQQMEFHLLVPSNKSYHLNYKNQYRIYCNEPVSDHAQINEDSLYNIKVRYNENENTIYLRNLMALNEIRFYGEKKGTDKFDFYIKEDQIYNNTDYNFTYLFGKRKDQYYMYAPLKSKNHIAQTEYVCCANEESLYRMILEFMRQHVPNWEQQRQYEYMTYFIQQKEKEEDYIVGITMEYEQNIFEQGQVKESGITAIRIPLTNSPELTNDSREGKENAANR